MSITFKQQHIFIGAALLVSATSAPLAMAITPDVVNYAGDGTVWKDNVSRQFNFAGGSITSAGFGTMFHLNTQEQSPSATIDGAGTSWNMNNGQADSFVSLQLTLSQSMYLRRFKTWVDTNHKPQSYEIYTSNTGFGSMTQAIGPTAIGAGALFTNTLNSAVQARYVEYRFSGVQGGTTVGLEEVQVYTDQALQPQPTSSDGFNLTTLPNVSISSPNPSKWLDNVANVIDQDFEGQFRGANSGDAQFVIDLKGEFVLTKLSMGFRHNNAWNQGAKLEVSEDGINYTTVYNQVGGNFGTTVISVPKITAEFVRVTDYGGSNNALNEMEIFGTIPEPATISLAGWGVGAIMLRRRNR